MPTCTGNDQVISIYINRGRVSIGQIHEKDEDCEGRSRFSHNGTACLVSNELKLLKYGETTDDWEVDDSKLIPCIVEEFYRMNEKNQHDELTENVFAMYIETVLKSSIRKEMFRFKKIKHCVVTLPDKWGPTYLDSMKQRLIESSVFDDLLVIKQSHSLIRHLQSPQYNHVFKNGEFYIVCYFKGVCEVTLYGYEIGPPIKGLKNIADHTVTEIRDFEREDFEEEYVVSVLFGGNKKKAAHYHLNVRELIEYSYNQYRLYPETTLFHIVREINHEQKLDSLLADKRLLLKLLTLDDIRSNANIIPTLYFKTIKNDINQLKALHHNIRVFIINDANYIYRENAKKVVTQLPPELNTSHHLLHKEKDRAFVNGAAQVMQDHLRLANYIPQVVNKGAADNIWHRNVLHIDITWDKNSALFVDSEKRETFLADVSDKIPDCYPLHQCWFIQGHIHHSNLCNMNITRQFMQMVRVNNETLRSTFYTEKSFSRDTHSRAVSVTRSRTILFMNNVGKLLKPAPPINTRSMLNGHEKHTLNTPSQTPLSILYQYKKQIPTSVQKTLFKVYIECLQMHILKHFMSNGQIKSADSLYIYVSIEQSILDLFLMEYGQLRLHLLNPESVSHLPMKLIHREQVAAVYCKTQLKCYDQVKVYLDYPQYAVQVQMNHTYINLSLHAIIPLERDVKMSKAETVLTLKRKIIPFDIVDAISEYFWEYMDTLDENRINPCHEHCVTDYEDHPDLYIQFIECFREYFTQEFTILNQDGLIDWYTMKQIRMNKRCGCTFPMSNLDLFDSCIYPAIEQVTPIIYASLTNSCLFKKYKVTYLVMMGNLMDLKGCPSTYTQVANRLKESIEYQRKYHNDIHVEWIDQSISSTVIKGVRHITKNPLSGLLEQIYAGTYKLRSRDLFPKNVFGSNEEDHPLIMEGTRITEKMREDGASLYLNVKVKDIQAEIWFIANGEKVSSFQLLKIYKMSNIDISYPITVRVFPGLGELTMSVHRNADGKMRYWQGSNKPFSLRENLILTPF